MNDTLNLLEENNTTTSATTTGTNDNTWSRGDIMTLAFGLFTVFFTLPALYFAWVGYLKEKLKERKKAKDRARVEEIERAKEVSRRARGK